MPRTRWVASCSKPAISSALASSSGLVNDGPCTRTGRPAASGAVTASQACRLGGRLPLPVVGPMWVLARAVSERIDLVVVSAGSSVGARDETTAAGHGR